MKKIYLAPTIVLVSLLIFLEFPLTSVSAISSGDNMDDQRPVEPTGDFITINVDGIIDDYPSHLIRIPFIDLALTSPHQIKKQEIVNAINYKLLGLRPAFPIEVDNLAYNAKLSDRDRTYDLNQEIIVLEPKYKTAQQKYTLFGQIKLKRAADFIHNPAQFVKLSYRAKFFTKDPKTNELKEFRTYTHNDIDTLAINREISSLEFVNFAKKLVAENKDFDGYQITQRQQTTLVENYDHETDYLGKEIKLYNSENPAAFTYHVKDRPQQVSRDKAGTVTREVNRDAILEEYVVAPKKQDRPYFDESQIAMYPAQFKYGEQVTQVGEIQAINDKQAISWDGSKPVITGKDGQTYYIDQASYDPATQQFIVTLATATDQQPS
ncbi:hypothetical protein [Streptococcus halichoeri]|uniref:hypothetical protein n=1 Tax=Streptococcus halichoeri TaxID=254785 RepID=UPI00135BE1C8|nr:hypothetical protein [Streptococcus halichoeri]